MINWRVRLRNKNFWMAIIPAVLMLLKSVCAIFGYELEIANISAQLLAVVEAAFVVLSIVGIVADPTTYGIGDSNQALGYDEPKRD